MFPVDEWSKERVNSVMMELLYSFNFMWVLMEEWVKKNCPDKTAREEMLEMYEQFGYNEAKRLEKTLQAKNDGVDRLISFLEHSHWCAFEDIEITKISKSSFRMRTLNCTAQKAAKKWGMDFYECSLGAQKIRSGFFRYINPLTRVTPVFTPPQKAGDGTPPGANCEWIVSIE